VKLHAEYRRFVLQNLQQAVLTKDSPEEVNDSGETGSQLQAGIAT
jgi:hypothetical protein